MQVLKGAKKMPQKSLVSKRGKMCSVCVHVCEAEGSEPTCQCMDMSTCVLLCACVHVCLEKAIEPRCPSLGHRGLGRVRAVAGLQMLCAQHLLE